jgi:hypothetical protein
VRRFKPFDFTGCNCGRITGDADIEVGSRKGFTLHLGEKFKDFTNLNRLFNLRQAGVYSVIVAQDFPLDGSPEPKLYTAISNKVEITILDPKKNPSTSE